MIVETLPFDDPAKVSPVPQGVLREELGQLPQGLLVSMLKKLFTSVIYESSQ